MVIAAAAYVFVASERIIHRQYEAPLVDIYVPSDSTSIVEGERLARIRGCTGCHGWKLEGRRLSNDFMYGRTTAPSLTATVRTLSTAEFVRAVRHGVRANGEGLQEMPSPMYYHLTDADLGKIIAFIRSVPHEAGLAYQFDPGPLTRLEIARGEWLPWPEDIQQMGPPMDPPVPGDTVRIGEYLTRTVCSECHGIDLKGYDDTPPLLVGGAYPDSAFMRLMRTGVPVSGRDLRLMDDVARSRFAHLTDTEIISIHTFLRSLLNAQVSGGTD